MNSGYMRDDIYYCDCCAQFFDCVTHEVVDVKYEEMPAELAISLMLYRQYLGERQRQRKHKRQRRAYRNRN